MHLSALFPLLALLSLSLPNLSVAQDETLTSTQLDLDELDHELELAPEDDAVSSDESSAEESLDAEESTAFSADALPFSVTRAPRNGIFTRIYAKDTFALTTGTHCLTIGRTLLHHTYRYKLYAKQCRVARLDSSSSRYAFHALPVSPSSGLPQAMFQLAINRGGTDYCVETLTTGSYLRPCNAKSTKFQISGAKEDGKVQLKWANKRNVCLVVSPRYLSYNGLWDKTRKITNAKCNSWVYRNSWWRKVEL